MRRRILLTFSLALLALFLPGNVAADAVGNSKVWDYPLRPGVPGWEHVTNRYKVLQIPAEIVAQMTTDDLAASCLAFPCSTEIVYSSKSYEHGFAYILKHFKALQALYARPDAPDALIRLYESINGQATLPHYPDRRLTFIHYAFLCQILKGDEVVSKLSPDQAKRLLLLSLDHAKQNRTKLGGSSNGGDAASLAARVMVAKRIAIALPPPSPTAPLASHDLSFDSSPQFISGASVSAKTARKLIEGYLQAPAPRHAIP